MEEGEENGYEEAKYCRYLYSSGYYRQHSCINSLSIPGISELAKQNTGKSTDLISATFFINENVAW